jgi:CubicO group peptidase (beta-lactamase class C family)
MASVFTPDTLPGRQAGEGFGLSVRVVSDPAARNTFTSKGTFGWSGAFNTHFFIDPVEHIVGIFMTQSAYLPLARRAARGPSKLRSCSRSSVVERAVRTEGAAQRAFRFLRTSSIRVVAENCALVPAIRADSSVSPPGPWFALVLTMDIDANCNETTHANHRRRDRGTSCAWAWPSRVRVHGVPLSSSCTERSCDS